MKKSLSFAQLLTYSFLIATVVLPSAGADSHDKLTGLVKKVSPSVQQWRRDIHQNPELGNREVRTSRLVEKHLRKLGLEVNTGIAHTGVVGLLKGSKPGPVVALRADMDALPVTEQVDLPFASKVRTTYKGREVGVMHACGHDAHSAILMGVAEVLTSMKKDLKGSVKFIFQPAEEGPPEGEEGGAKLMIEEGVLKDPAPEVIFGLHTFPAPPGVIGYRSGGIMAGADSFKMRVSGSQTHGGMPWAGVDPIVVTSQIIQALQLIPSRQLDSTRGPVVISIGSIHGGLRSNIIPGHVDVEGTIRILDPVLREEVLRRIKQTASSIAKAAGASAEVTILPYSPVTFNDPALVRKMLPTLQRVAGPGLTEVRPVTPSEDFAWFQKEIPGIYFFLGINNEGVSAEDAAPNHSPNFYINEATLPLGVTALSSLVLDYMDQAVK